jgi:hypothetical protein
MNGVSLMMLSLRRSGDRHGGCHDGIGVGEGLRVSHRHTDGRVREVAPSSRTRLARDDVVFVRGIGVLRRRSL